jgi:DNA replication protein DnaC
MKREAIQFADDMLNQRTPRWLSFLGTSGAGKTMLAKTIWRAFDERLRYEINWPATRRSQCYVDGKPTKHGQVVKYRGGFLNWGKAMNRMLKGDYDFLEDLRTWDFFCLDDIASEYDKLRELSSAKLYDVLESRLGRWTVITANLSLEAISDRLDARIASRMLRNGGTVIDVSVPDFNLRRRAA